MKSFLLFLGFTSCVAASRDALIDLAVELQSHPNGYMNPKQELTAFEAGHRGIVAVQSISAGDLLVSIPWSMITASDESGCSAVFQMVDDLSEDTPSAYARSLQNWDPSLPNSWHQDALQNVIDLPPYDWTTHSLWFESECLPKLPQSDGDPVDVNDRHMNEKQATALWLFVSRTTSVGMAPIYDLHNHGRGMYDCVEQHVDYGIALNITAIRDVQAGQQIYDDYGGSTPRIFRDYGFVEPLPQIWDIIPNHSFQIDENEMISWSEGRPQTSTFEKVSASIREALDTPIVEGDHIDPKQISVALEYREAMTRALQLAEADIVLHAKREL